MRLLALVRDKDGRYEGYCGTCRIWRLLGRYPGTVYRRITAHEQRHERAAAVAEAERIVQEGARNHGYRTD